MRWTAICLAALAAACGFLGHEAQQFGLVDLDEWTDGVEKFKRFKLAFLWAGNDASSLHEAEDVDPRRFLGHDGIPL